MKHSILFFSVVSLLFAHSSYSNNSKQLSDIDVSTETKQQIMDGFLLRQAFKTFKQQNRNSGSFATVGSDDDCDYRIGSTKIQDAIDLGEIEIRVAMNDTYDTNIVIDDKSVIIKGGYSDCTAAVAGIQSDRTNLGNVSSGRIIKITGDTQRNTVILDSLSLINGQGGVFTENTNLQLQMFNTIISGNVAVLGGGIRISGGNTDVELENTLIISNEGEDSGGGIYCFGFGSSLIMHGFSGIYGNKVTNTNEVAPGVVFGASGGGATFTDGCSFLNYSGGTGGFLDFRGFLNNTATGQGGGLFISTGSVGTLFGHQVCVENECLGNNSEPVSMLNNISGFGGAGALSGGGAAHVVGSGSTLNIYAGLVSGNESLSAAGAIQLNSSNFTTKRLSKSCWSQEHCNYYEGNKGGSGGVLGFTNSIVEISNAVIENNRANFATVLLINNNSTVTVENSIIHHNGNFGIGDYDDKNIIWLVNSDSLLTINYSTIIDNQVTESLLLTSNSSQNINFVSSIIHDSLSIPINDDVGQNNTLSSECSIVHEDDSLKDQSFTAVVADPGFVDRAGKDYHISPSASLAVDYCFKNNTSTVDMDFETRGYDDPTVNNNLGVFDIGADETIINDIIYKDGFEP